MRRHWEYLKYVLRHKWFVFVAGIKIGVPIHLLIFHDMSKFRPFEWFAYTRTFHEPNGKSRYEPDKHNFDVAWLYHIHRNKHHWQYWILIWDKTGEDCLPMPDKYRAEMLADWRGAAKAQGNNVREWYAENRVNIKLHPDTRWFFDTMLKYMPPIPEVKINA